MYKDSRKNGQQPLSITPSTSPPFKPDQPAALSKSHISSGSSIRSGSRFLSTPVSTPDTPDLTSLRSESTSRLLSVWSSLADRYSLRVDEDDIIDIRTGQMVKDRGVVRGLRGKWDFGRFADEDGLLEEERPEEAESDDELNAIPSQGPSEQDIVETPSNPFLALSNLSSRATRAIDAKNDENDAADLRAFLEADRLRREAQGDVQEHESSSEDLAEEDDDDFVTDVDTDTEAELNTEGESEPVCKQVVEGSKKMEEKTAEKNEASNVETGCRSNDSEDELEFWDNDEFDIPSSDTAPRSSSSQPKLRPVLITPPHSQGYVDVTEPVSFSPPPLSPAYANTRSKSKARSSRSADEHHHLPTPAPSTSPRLTLKMDYKRSLEPGPPQCTSSHVSSEDVLNFVDAGSDTSSQSSIAAPFLSHGTVSVKSPSISIRSESSFPSLAPTKIPRLDLTQFSKLRRNARSQSRSPSKLINGNFEDAAAKVTPVASSSRSENTSRTNAQKGPSESDSTATSRSQSLAQLKPKPKMSSARGKSTHGGGCDKEEGESKTFGAKGKAKAREVIEIDDSDDLDDDFSSSFTSSPQLSAKFKGKKRARPSRSSWSDEDEQERGVGSGIETQGKPKPMGSPTKKGRYNLSSDADVELAAYHPEELEVGMPHAFLSSSAGRAPPSRVPIEPRHSKAESQRRKLAPVASSDEANPEDPAWDEETFVGPSQKLPVSRSQSRRRVRTSSGSVSHVIAHHHESKSNHGFDKIDLQGDHPMHSSRTLSQNTHQTCVSAEHGYHHSRALLPTAAQMQMEQILKERAKHIVSNAIEGLRSLLSPEALSSTLEEPGLGSSPKRRLRHLSASDGEVGVVTYTPRKALGIYQRYDADSSLSSMSSPPLSSSSSYATPTSHRSHQQSHSQSYSFDPKYSKGSLPPSSAHSESDEEKHDRDLEADRHDFRRDEYTFPTPSSSPISSRLRRHRPSNPPSQQQDRQHDQSSPLPRASSIVHRSRSRGRKVSFKETAIQTQTKTGLTQRTLSREISVEDSEVEFVDADDADDVVKARREGGKIKTPSLVTQRGRQLQPRQQPHSPAQKSQYKSVEAVEMSNSNRKGGPGHPRKFKDFDKRKGR